MLDRIENPALSRWYRAGTEIEIGAHRHFYREAGKGPVLLLVHGFPTSSWDWHKVFDELSQHFRLIAPDMLGFGFSDKPAAGDYSCAAHARFHEQLLSALGISRAHVLTYSFGSSVVQQMMANERARRGADGLSIESITFLNGGLFPDSNHPNIAQKLLLSPVGPLVARMMGQAALSKNLRRIFGPKTQPSEELLAQYWQLLMLSNGRQRLPQLIGYLRDRSRLASVWCDALIRHPARQQLIVGLWDSISGADLAAQYRQTLSGARITELDGIGHYPQLEKPEVVIKAVTKLCFET